MSASISLKLNQNICFVFFKNIYFLGFMLSFKHRNLVLFYIVHSFTNYLLSTHFGQSIELEQEGK